MSVDFIPFCKKGIGIEFPEADMTKSILETFYERSRNIALPGFIETEYEKFCIENGIYYMGAFAGFGRILRKIDSLMHGVLTGQIYSLNKLNMLQNFIECEAHRELFLKYLRVRRKEK
jgi:hypothetical protein